MRATFERVIARALPAGESSAQFEGESTIESERWAARYGGEWIF